MSGAAHYSPCGLAWPGGGLECVGLFLTASRSPGMVMGRSEGCKRCALDAFGRTDRKQYISRIGSTPPSPNLSTRRCKQREKMDRDPHQATLRVLGVLRSGKLRPSMLAGVWKSGPNSCYRGVQARSRPSSAAWRCFALASPPLPPPLLLLLLLYFHSAVRCTLCAESPLAAVLAVCCSQRATSLHHDDT